jgi:tetratricopeptide (TPR) repeat protein
LEQKLSETTSHLRKDLATEYKNIADQLSWIEDKIVFSTQAKIAYQHAVELNKEDSNAWYGLGTSLALEGENESATDAFKKATQLDPKFASPYNGLGNVYQSQDKFDLAIQSYQKSIELDPKSASSPYNGLGNTYQAQGNYESAIKFYTMAIELDPQFAYPHNGLGVVYQAQNNYEAAITYYEKAISLDSKFPYAKLNLGFILWLQDKHDDAISLWKEGSALLNDENSEYRQYAKFVGAWHKFLIGQTYDDINSLREVLQTEKLPVSLISDVLKDAETIAQLSTKLEGIDTVIEMLRQAIEKAQ